MKCSVIILNWNGEKMLRQFLPSVLASINKCRYINRDADATCRLEVETKDVGAECAIEVVVADNGSTDDSIALLQEEFLPHHSNLRILPLEQNYGFAEGYNRAIQAIEAEYVVLLNSDVEVTENWLEPILSYLDANKDVAAAQPKILKWQAEKTQIDTFEHAGAAGGYLDRLGYPYCRGRIMDYVEEDKGQYDTPADVFWASGACLVIRRDVYLAEGGLDAEFFAHMEEIDLCWRLNCRGYRLVCLPESKVYHVGGGSLSYDNPRKTFLNFRNNLLMIFKNIPANRLCRVLLIRFAMDYAAALVYLLKGQVGNFSAVFKARWAFLKMRKSFADKRKENLQKSKVPYPSTIIDRSIVWDYYVRRKRQ